MNLIAEPTPCRPAAPAVPGGAPAAADPQARLQHLFRALTRAGRVHPLHHLMLRYRAGEGGQ